MDISDASPRPPDGSAAACPSRRALRLLSNKWSPLVVHALLAGPLRTNALRRRLPGVSQKVLSQTLRELEASGLVVRSEYLDSPVPHVEYALSELGRSLSSALAPVDEWAVANADALR